MAGEAIWGRGASNRLHFGQPTSSGRSGRAFVLLDRFYRWFRFDISMHPYRADELKPRG